MSRSHSNISVFVPHIGCPNMCSFCNQRYITGTCKAPHPEDVEAAVLKAAAAPGFNPRNTEIAFFGGSFTAISRGYMESLLKSASRFVNNGTVSGIRISTRPDAIDGEILELLKKYRVAAIELGAQSMNDRVLKMNNRGHTAADVVKSAELIRSGGFELGIQMMTGLYGDSDTSAINTAKKIIALGPDTVRIYPTIVLKDTYLAALYLDKRYSPQPLDGAVALASKLLLMFEKEGIKVIRLGLHSIENNAFIAGPWHPAFSELCLSNIYLSKAITKLRSKGSYTIYVNPAAVSQMTGQKKSNLAFLRSRGFDCRVKTKDYLGKYELEIEKDV